MSQFFSNINNGIQDAVNSLTNNNYLNYAVTSGFGDIPIAAYGMTIIVLSTLAYATAADSNNLPDISNIVKNMSNIIPSFATGKSSSKTETLQMDESKKIAEEEAEYEKTIQKEEQEKQKEAEAEAEAEEKKKESSESKSKSADKNKEDEEDEDDSESRSRRGGGRRRRKMKTKKRRATRG